MKKILLTMLTALLSIGLYAQVGIGTESPKASLDIVAKKGTTADGLLIPRLTVKEVKAMESKVKTEQNSLLIYITDITGKPTTAKYTDIDAIGYYYYNANNSKWKKLGNATAYTAGTGISISGSTISGNYQGTNGVSVSGSTISGNYQGTNGVNVSGNTISGNYQGAKGVDVSGNTISLPTGNNGEVLKWNGSKWVGATIPTPKTYTASNGVTLNGNNLELGGTITKNATITNSNNLNFTGSGNIIIGENQYLGVGTPINTKPGAKFHVKGSVKLEGLNTVTNDSYVLTQDNNGVLHKTAKSSLAGRTYTGGTGITVNNSSNIISGNYQGADGVTVSGTTISMETDLKTQIEYMYKRRLTRSPNLDQENRTQITGTNGTWYSTPRWIYKGEVLVLGIIDNNNKFRPYNRKRIGYIEVYCQFRRETAIMGSPGYMVFGNSSTSANTNSPIPLYYKKMIDIDINDVKKIFDYSTGGSGVAGLVGWEGAFYDGLVTDIMIYSFDCWEEYKSFTQVVCVPVPQLWFYEE